ncbi:MAG: hypothetical protein AVDCRST_MAG40-1829, partial [uncultured Gemmatimonadaceae bacterium]
CMRMWVHLSRPRARCAPPRCRLSSSSPPAPPPSAAASRRPRRHRPRPARAPAPRRSPPSAWRPSGRHVRSWPRTRRGARWRPSCSTAPSWEGWCGARGRRARTRR